MSELEITRAEQTAAILEGRGESSFMGATTVISVRLPVIQEAEIQAFAKKANKTRNAMISILLDVGMEAVRSHLSEETAEEIRRSIVIEEGGE